ncbi:Com family DNA-binding transcriptional regulator [Marinomonas ostreistagni]|uniref:Com family DNA-binding transcriptional regulator n=2 Tax=Marinomonas ostreistagni TaxID=359209 RepID=A0ABS0ZAP7_9GAMM|nr:Com family DNA-binding transcriptional regulator [Marinomonas ostreistagni]
MQEIRCTRCNKLLARGVFVSMEIKCPRCSFLNERASSPTHGVPDHGKTNHSMDRGQAEAR